MKIHLLLILLIGIGILYACDSETNTDFPTEIIQDSRISDSIFNFLLDDAKLISLDFFTNEEMDELQDVEINEMYVAPIYAALQFVYLDSISIVSSEVKEYNIHTLCPIRLHKNTITIDTSSQYIVSWKENQFSNDLNLDLLIQNYQLHIDSLGKDTYEVWADVGVNQEALVKELQEFPFVYKAQASNCAGDGSHIEIQYFGPDFIHLIYSYGWGDCPSGCINRHYWEIGVYGTGLVELIAEYGRDLPKK